MRPPALAFVCLTFLACAPESAEPMDRSDYCLHGLRVRRDALLELRAMEPQCTRDEECVVGAARVEGRCGFINLCGDVVHRTTAVAWDAEMVGEEMCLGAPRSPESICSFETSCSAVSPVCRMGRCVRGDIEDFLTPQDSE